MDIDTARQNVFDHVLNGVNEKYPIENATHSLEIVNPRYEGPKKFSIADQKKAILSRSNLDWKLKGTYQLRDKATGQVISSADKVIARVPYMTDRGTFIFRGNEFAIASQQRLKPGIYARQKENGELESHANLIPGTGASFRMAMDPKSGVFRIHMGQGTVPMYSLLRNLGVTENEIAKAWGNELYLVNAAKDDPKSLDKLYSRMADSQIKKTHGADTVNGVKATFDKMRLDPEVMGRNLGKPYDRVTGEALLDATSKLLKIHRGEADSDDRDAQANQKLMGVEDIFKERIVKDAGQHSRKLLWKAANSKRVDNIPSSALSPQIYSALLGSGLGNPLTEVNPLDIMDQMAKVTRLGEGGIGGDAVPMESRSVQPSQLGFIDPVRSPESGNVGVDMRLAAGTKRGSDGNLYREMRNIRTGQMEHVNAQTVAHKVLAFPGEMERPDLKVRAMVGDKVRYVPRNQVDYAIAEPEHMFTAVSNLVPITSSIKGGRLLMGAKFFNQALALKNPEAPLVQSAMPGGDKSFEQEYAKHAGAVRAHSQGVVTHVSPDSITVDYDGKKVEHDLYNHFPYNQKSFIHSTPVVKPGDQVGPDQLLAHSNFTDKKGDLALGINLRVAYLPHSGGNYEDAYVISEGAAKKLTSEHMTQMKFDIGEGHKVGRGAYLSTFPGRFSRDQLGNIGDDGAVKPGTIVRHGDPLVLAVNTKKPQAGATLHRLNKTYHSDDALVWDHKNDGIVTDVWRDEDGVKVAVKNYAPMEVGDKLAGRHGSKGVIGKILSDDQMPRDADGKPYDLLANPQGVLTRTNPGIMAEVLLGKIARKTGQPYKLRSFMPNIAQFALNEAKRHGVAETEKVFDPHTNRWMPVFTGETFMMKLYHVAESKAAGRDIGSYTSEGQPSKVGKEDSSKRIGNLDLLGVLAHSAPAVLEDAKTIRGQKNDQFWADYRSGKPYKMPDVPLVFHKFLNYLRGAGINVDNSGGQYHLSAMTDKDVDKLSRGELQHGDAVRAKDNNPIPGGVFDVGITGGHHGTSFSHLKLDEPTVSPVMEAPVRRLLGLTKPAFENLLRQPDGGEQIKARLDSINVPQEIDRQKQIIKDGKKSKRDDAVKLLGYLTGAQKAGLHPRDFMLTKVPVVPPVFRPVTLVNGMQLTSDANLLYKDLYEANKNLKEMKQHSADVGEERLAVYNALKAVTGLGNPISQKLQDKGVAGLLEHVFGKGSPKTGLFQRRVLANPVDVVGRATITPDSQLNMDQVGIPESKAWTIFQPFIMRKLAQRYNTAGQNVPLTTLAKWVSDKDPRAKEALLEAMKERPVLINRAPVLHKYGFMAAYPVLTAGDTLRVSPIVTAGFGADFDGDAMNFQVPVSDAAVRQAKERMLPSANLRATGNFDVHYLPRQEFLHGLYELTKGVDPKKDERVFATIADAIRAYHRGEIGADHPVNIKE